MRHEQSDDFSPQDEWIIDWLIDFCEFFYD